jgi:hypothetical protein
MGITTKILQKEGPALWMNIHGVIKIVWNKEEIPLGWKIGIAFPI